ncbi:GntR family transcriptional regulator [Enterococcus florum]|uniref:GntR family transcriptional regulator n=1 Tax=Enterococcus florum TaxID=2480627 RepID=A0A4P5PCQ0_9ENTE|nr:GntR family transcriptional regulator [Enterococcus florum]GCF95920.1 GntR family transcriptional regulator [Enterococcus florum]
MENNTEKKYELVINYILSNIENGVFQPHQMIESEMELSKKLNVSRVTVRKGLEELVNNKVLSKRKGKGTFVNPIPKYFGFKSGIGFSSEAKKRGLAPSTKLLSIEKVPANSKVADLLKVPVDTLTWRIERIRYADSVAICYEEEFFDAQIVPEITADTAEHSIYDYLEAYDITFSYVDQKIVAENATEKYANYLNVDVNTALINMEVIACLENGKPFNVGFSKYQTNNFFLVQTIYK